MVWKSIVMFYYSYNDVKRRFNLSHMDKVSAQTFARGCKKCIRLRKTLSRFLDWSGSLLLCSIILIMMLSDVLILVIWTK